MEVTCPYGYQLKPQLWIANEGETLSRDYVKYRTDMALIQLKKSAVRLAQVLEFIALQYHEQQSLTRKEMLTPNKAKAAGAVNVYSNLFSDDDDDDDDEEDDLTTDEDEESLDAEDDSTKNGASFDSEDDMKTDADDDLRKNEASFDSGEDMKGIGMSFDADDLTAEAEEDVVLPAFVSELRNDVTRKNKSKKKDSPKKRTRSGRR